MNEKRRKRALSESKLSKGNEEEGMKREVRTYGRGGSRPWQRKRVGLSLCRTRVGGQGSSFPSLLYLLRKDGYLFLFRREGVGIIVVVFTFV